MTLAGQSRTGTKTTGEPCLRPRPCPRPSCFRAARPPRLTCSFRATSLPRSIFNNGLSDEAGAGANVGFGAKVSGAPVQAEVSKLDLYITTTLYGIKPGLPYGASLQCIEGEAASEAPSCSPGELVGPTADGVMASMFWVPTNLTSGRKMPGCTPRTPHPRPPYVALPSAAAAPALEPPSAAAPQRHRPGTAPALPRHRPGTAPAPPPAPPQHRPGTTPAPPRHHPGTAPA